MKKLLYLLLVITVLQVKAQNNTGKKTNIVWITCEDISPYIGVYGEKAVRTPNIDQLAKEGIQYKHAYTTAGVCAPSRSAIITGMYQTSIGTQHMRTKAVNPKYMGEGVPNYSAVIPDYVKAFPEYLRANGYYTTNNEKQDYQFDAPVTVWDENGPAASYRNRPAGKPFFSVFNNFITHESQLFKKDSLLVDPRNVTVPPYYEDTKQTRIDIARQLTHIQIMDRQVGEIVSMLKKDGLYENTIIFFYSDHGGALPWMKREVLDRGLHIPLIVRMPGGQGAGTVNSELISGVDLAPTVLSLAGITIPKHLQGQAFLGGQQAKAPRKYIYGARDRMDEKYDRVRAVRDKRFEYIYNYMPEKPHYQDLNYRHGIPMMKEMLALRDAGKLNPNAMAWFKVPKDVEELYDTEKDPHQLHNLATDPQYKAKLEELRTAFRSWEKAVGDMSAVPEKEMVYGWWGGKDKAPTTATPLISSSQKGAAITCATKGASIGYRIVKAGQEKSTEKHTVRTWDAGLVMDAAQNGKQVEAAPVWQVYTGQTIKLNKGDQLLVNAMRIGYEPATAEYIQQ
jgi:N-sulfoglucosamine sulfohydrolase